MTPTQRRLKTYENPVNNPNLILIDLPLTLSHFSILFFLLLLLLSTSLFFCRSCTTFFNWILCIENVVLDENEIFVQLNEVT